MESTDPTQYRDASPETLFFTFVRLKGKISGDERLEERAAQVVGESIARKLVLKSPTLPL